MCSESQTFWLRIADLPGPSPRTPDLTGSKCLIYCNGWAFMSEQRLGDVIDDHCIKCRRITNHSIVSLVDGQAAKVRCRTCYHDHDYRHEIAPPTKKELKKAEALNMLASDNGQGSETTVPSGKKPKTKSEHA